MSRKLGFIVAVALFSLTLQQDASARLSGRYAMRGGYSGECPVGTCHAGGGHVTRHVRFCRPRPHCKWH
jgi:hypothetical protein